MSTPGEITQMPAIGLAVYPNYKVFYLALPNKLKSLWNFKFKNICPGGRECRSVFFCVLIYFWSIDTNLRSESS